MRTIVSLIGISAAAVALVACASSDTPTKPRSHELVRITNMTLEPTVVRIAEGGNVSWISVGNYAGRIAFPASTAASFTCKDLRPILTLDGDRLISNSVNTDEDNVELPCPLVPGEYDYTVGLTERGPFGSDPSAFDTIRSLKGKIIVE